MANFCAKSDVQAALHPEIRAEIAFGLENSTGMLAGEALGNLCHFSAQDADWRDAEQEIIAALDETWNSLPWTSAGRAAGKAEAG